MAVRIANPALSHGYEARVQTEPGIYIRKCLVKNKEGLAWMFVINTGYKDVNLIIPPVELEEFTGVPASIRTIWQANIEDPAQDLEKRISAIVQALDLEDLNEEERASVIALVSHLFGVMLRKEHYEKFYALHPYYNIHTLVNHLL